MGQYYIKLISEWRLNKIWNYDKVKYNTKIDNR